MKRRVAALVLLMVLGPAVCVSASEENLPEEGTRQLVFGFSGWNLTNYKGGIGIRYFLREKTALRFGLGFGWTKDDDTGWDHDVYEQHGVEQTINDNDGSTFSVGLGTVLERHFTSSMKVRPYAGLGVFWWYDKSESDERLNRTDVDYARSYEYESKGYTVEGLVLAGLEWHFAPNMSLGGEYRMSLTYSRMEYDRTEIRTDADDERRSTEHDTRKDYRLTVDASRLWLSIAF
jgi:opacity protein-like surface antigen